MENWTDEECQVLNNIRINCVLFANAHKSAYFKLKDTLIYYRLPIIILSGCNSIISVGLQPYATQGAISITTSLIALTCSIIGSIELFFGIQKRLENHLVAQRDFYLLGIDIFKTLSLAPHSRPIPSKDYIEKSYNTYIRLIESSDIIGRSIADKLVPLTNQTGVNGLPLISVSAEDTL
jgi:hypothetical protein